MEVKEIIIEKFYEEHLKPSVIAKELGVNPSYVTKIIKKIRDILKKRNIELKSVRKITK